ncbi:unnamed protein product [Camellia sinensis]
MPSDLVSNGDDRMLHQNLVDTAVNDSNFDHLHCDSHDFFVSHCFILIETLDNPVTDLRDLRHYHSLSVSLSLSLPPVVVVVGVILLLL